MTQPSIIGIQTTEGLIRTILLANGGPPSWIGVLLDRYYSTRSMAQELVNHGNLVWLGLTIDECQWSPGSKNVTTYANVTLALRAAEFLKVNHLYLWEHKAGWVAFDTQGTRIQINPSLGA